MVSVVMPTFNKAFRLKITLEYLKFLKSHKDIEFIIVNDGSSDCTEKIIEDFFASLPLNYFNKIKVIKTKNQGRSSARNEGIFASENDIVLFLDDDVIVDPNLVEEHLYKHKRNENIVVRGKIFELPYLKFFYDPAAGKMHDESILTKSLESKIIKNYQTFDLLFNDYLVKNMKLSKFEKDIENLYEITEESNSNIRWIGCIGANFSISKKAAEEIGYFDNKFGLTWGCEDLEFGYRLSKIGYKFVFCKDAVCYHLSHLRKNYKNNHQNNMNYFISKYDDYQLKLLQKYFNEEISLIDWVNMERKN